MSVVLELAKRALKKRQLLEKYYIVGANIEDVEQVIDSLERRLIDDGECKITLANDSIRRYIGEYFCGKGFNCVRLTHNGTILIRPGFSWYKWYKYDDSWNQIEGAW